MLASTVLALIAGTLSILAVSAHVGSKRQRGVTLLMQHGRVAKDRIERDVLAAYANEQFPGFVVIADTVDGYRFPDTLAIWRPAGKPADPTGLPLVGELVLYTTDKDNRSELVMVTWASNTSSVPATSDEGSWRRLRDSMLKSKTARRTTITPYLRAESIDQKESHDKKPRAALLFTARLRPDESEFAAYRRGDLTWPDLHWPQGIRGGSVGLRQNWCSFELQLISAEDEAEILPFFGSAAIYYDVSK
jgi:hypothetical protein